MAATGVGGRRAFQSISILSFAAGISFLPMAALNQVHAGQRAKDMNHSTGLQISNPVAGILGLYAAARTETIPSHPFGDRSGSVRLTIL